MLQNIQKNYGKQLSGKKQEKKGLKEKKAVPLQKNRFAEDFYLFCQELFYER